MGAKRRNDRLSFFKRVVDSCQNPDHIAICRDWYPQLLEPADWEEAEKALIFQDGFLCGRGESFTADAESWFLHRQKHGSLE